MNFWDRHRAQYKFMQCFAVDIFPETRLMTVPRFGFCFQDSRIRFKIIGFRSSESALSFCLRSRSSSLLVAIILSELSWKFYLGVDQSFNNWNESDEKYNFHIFGYSLLFFSQNDSNVISFHWKLFILCHIHPSKIGIFDLMYYEIWIMRHQNVGQIKHHYYFRFSCQMVVLYNLCTHTERHTLPIIYLCEHMICN